MLFHRRDLRLLVGLIAASFYSQAAFSAPANPADFFVDNYGGDHTGAVDSTAAAQAAIAAAQAYSLQNPQQTTRVIFGAGQYRITCSPSAVISNTKPCLNVNGVNHFVIRGQSGPIDPITQQPSAATELLIGNRNVAALSIASSQNVSVNFLAFDYNPLPFTQGTIVAVGAEPNTFDLQIDAGFPLLSDSFFSNPAAANWGMIYDRSRLGPKRNTPNIVATTKWTMISGTTGTFRVTAPAYVIPYMAPGDAYIQIARPPNSSTITIGNSSNITLDTDVVYASPLMAFVVGQGSGSLNLTNSEVRILPNSPRLHSTNGNATIFPNFRNTPGPSSGIVIQNNYFAGMSDDAIDIASGGAMVTAVSSQTSFTVQSIQPVSYQVGDQLQIIDTVTGQILGTPTVTEVTNSSRTQWTLTLDTPVTALSAGSGIAPTAFGQFYDGNTVYNLSTAGASAKITNNTFGPARGMGIRDCTTHCLIQDNKFTDINNNAIFMGANFFFMEGPMPQGVQIIGNTFNGGDANANSGVPATAQILLSTYSSVKSSNGLVSLQPSSFASINNILIENNAFSNSASESISVNGVSNFQLINNSNTASGSVPRFDSGSAVNLANSSNVTINGFNSMDPRSLTTAAVSFPACSAGIGLEGAITLNGSKGVALLAAVSGTQSATTADAVSGFSYNVCAESSNLAIEGAVAVYLCYDAGRPFVSVSSSCEGIKKPGQLLGYLYDGAYENTYLESSMVSPLIRYYKPSTGSHLVFSGPAPNGYSSEGVLGFIPTQ